MFYLRRIINWAACRQHWWVWYN